MHTEPHPCSIALTTGGHLHPASRTEGFIHLFRLHAFSPIPGRTHMSDKRENEP